MFSISKSTHYLHFYMGQPTTKQICNYALHSNTALHLCVWSGWGAPMGSVLLFHSYINHRWRHIHNSPSWQQFWDCLIWTLCLTISRISLKMNPNLRNLWEEVTDSDVNQNPRNRQIKEGGDTTASWMMMKNSMKIFLNIHRTKKNQSIVTSIEWDFRREKM